MPSTLRPLMLAVALTAFGGALLAQAPPELLYYTFDEGSGTLTQNHAQPGVGLQQAVVFGHTLTGTGQFGGALRGNGGPGTTSYVETGWNTNLGTGSWTISMWLDISIGGAGNVFMYMFGDSTAASFRCFTNGAAGTGGIILSGGGLPANVNIPNGAPPTGSAAVAWAYDATVPEVRRYLNGVRVATTPITTPLNIVGTAPFKVGTYATTTAMLSGTLMDEFRLYSRALSDVEVAATWNISLANTAAQYQTNQAGSSLDVNGIVGNSFTPALAIVPIGVTGFLNLASTNLGMPWELGTGVAPVIPRNAGAATTSDGQILNLALNDPTLFLWWNGFLSPPFVNLALPFSSTSALTVSLQMANIDPAHLSGISLSQPIRVLIQ